ncbi:GemA protein [Spirochaetia bacterium]|nr:GemA protein [Spirochaetia bacterium]
MADEKRKKLIQLIHVGKGKLGWDDAAYRAFLNGGWGKESAADMTGNELESALKAMRKAGFASKPRRVRPEEKGRASAAQLEYIKGMWAVCARNKSGAALLAFVKRIAHVDALRFLDAATARQVILALRDMMAKAGFNPDTSEAVTEVGK